MTTGGWIIMVLSVGFMTGLLGWSIWKVLSTPGEVEHLHSHADIDPGDAER